VVGCSQSVSDRKKSTVLLVRGSTASDPLPSFVAGALTCPATVKSWGIGGPQMVSVVARVGSARVLLAVMVPSVGIVGAVSPPLVLSCGDDSVVGMQDPNVVETNMEVLCVEEPSGFWRGFTGSSGE
jgi:hypothetical protein